MRSGSLDSGRASVVMYRYRNGGNRSGGRSMTFSNKVAAWSALLAVGTMRDERPPPQARVTELAQSAVTPVCSSTPEAMRWLKAFRLSITL